MRLGLLSGSFDSKRIETVGDAVIGDQSDTFRTLVPLVELGAGLGYQGEHLFFRTGYEVTDIQATLDKGKKAGVNVLVPMFASDDRSAAMLEFPGGYVAEVHALRSR